NTTGQQGTNRTWTLSVPPMTGSVMPDNASPATGSEVTWTAVGGFGAGTVQYCRYAWDQPPSHTWTATEPQWSSGTIATIPTAGGVWYLHVQGFNGANAANGVYDFAVTAIDPPAITGQPSNLTTDAGATASFTVVASGTSPSYQRKKNSVDLTDGGNVSGSTTPTLSLTG